MYNIQKIVATFQTARIINNRSGGRLRWFKAYLTDDFNYRARIIILDNISKRNLEFSKYECSGQEKNTRLIGKDRKKVVFIL